jgi:hypothetical protein
MFIFSLLYAPFLCDTTHCSINRFRRASRVARPSQGGEKRTAGWASRHEDLVSDGVVAAHVFDHMVVPDRGVVLARSAHRGQPWMPAWTLSHVRDGLRVRLMAVWCTFRRPCMCHPVHRQCMRNTWRDLSIIVPTTACHQSNDIETYSRCMCEV